MTLPLQHDGGDQALDLGRLELGLLALLDGQGPLDHVLTDVVVFVQVEELADLGGSLRAQTPWDGGVGQTGDLLLALLDDDQGEDGQVAVDDAAPDGLAFTLPGAALAVARVALGQQKADTFTGEDTLLHGHALLVVAAGDPEHVSGPFFA